MAQVAAEPEVAGEVIRIGAGTGLTSRLPVMGSWSFQASNATRVALRQHLARKQPDALFIHTQVAALLAVRAMRRMPTVISMDATPMNFDTLAEGYGHARRQGAVEDVKSWVNRLPLSRTSRLGSRCSRDTRSLRRTLELASDCMSLRALGEHVELP